VAVQPGTGSLGDLGLDSVTDPLAVSNTVQRVLGRARRCRGVERCRHVLNTTDPHRQSDPKTTV
jgi:hypothetical protein